MGQQKTKKNYIRGRQHVGAGRRYRRGRLLMKIEREWKGCLRKRMRKERKGMGCRKWGDRSWEREVKDRDVQLGGDKEGD